MSARQERKDLGMFCARFRGMLGGNAKIRLHSMLVGKLPCQAGQQQLDLGKFFACFYGRLGGNTKILAYSVTLLC